jgi:uncharacterized protein YbaA (DUF1428 family)
MMSYIDGYVIPVKTADKLNYVAASKRIDGFFRDHGARRIVETWGDDIRKGKVTDFNRAVQADDSESVVFSWIEWPDKPTRDMAWKAMESDQTMMAEPLPFDGKRMIYGGFTPIVEHGEAASDAYVQGFIIPVPAAKQEAYRKMADEAWDMFKDFGALRVVEAWQDDVPEGKQTDFFRSVNAEPGEKIVFSFMEWPSREVCADAEQKMMSDERMQAPPDMPFDPKRMIYGGFTPILEVKG